MRACARINPLKKIPALVLDDGSALFDSPVICEYLNEFGGGKFFPGMSVWRPTSGRWKALGLQALGDGIMDAAVACRYESTQPEERRNPDHIARYMATIEGGLDALERVTVQRNADHRRDHRRLRARLSRFPLCAILNGATAHPKLAEWFAKFSQYPSMLATAP